MRQDHVLRVVLFDLVNLDSERLVVVMTYISGLSQREAEDELEQLHYTDTCGSTLLYHGDVVQD